MKKTIILFVMTILSTAFLTAQTADEILDKYFELIGGKEKIATLKALRISAVANRQGMEFPITITKAAPDMQRIDIDIQGKKMIQAYDGKTAWWINPFMGGTSPEIMPADMAEYFTKDRFEDAYLNYKEKGHTVELVGKKDIEGTETFEIKMTKDNGDVVYSYFEAESFVLIMSKQAAKSGPTKGQFMEYYFSDYQEVDGFMFPFAMIGKMNGQEIQNVTMKKYEINPEVDMTIFAYVETKQPAVDSTKTNKLINVEVEVEEEKEVPVVKDKK